MGFSTEKSISPGRQIAVRSNTVFAISLRGPQILVIDNPGFARTRNSAYE
jgi:hypothetical protein